MIRPGRSLASTALALFLALPAAAEISGLREIPLDELVGEQLLASGFSLPDDAIIGIDAQLGVLSGVMLEAFSYDPATNIFSARLSDVAGGLTSVRGRIDITVPAVVPTRRLAAGEIVTASDLQETRLPLALAHENILREEMDVVGKEVRRTLTAGRPVADQSLIAPRLVRKGEKIEIAYDLDGMRLTATGKAMQDGAKGESVRILNTASNRMLSGTVVASGRVRIGPAP
ncbi:flagellar basal body P-ring formation chaperone FlgA [Paracoccus litorisediminis]|uniref:flagellar basal body P-ring formation chaperone FlgA n=1 Tax=Paracoccus litorisediminis TaxID=2006130 RepID=UPI00372FDE62